MAVKTLTKAELKAALVKREPGDHKGVYGHVLIAAGSRGMAGAAILAARAALRSGAGVVTVAVPYGVAPVVAGAVPSAMTLSLPDTPVGVFRPDGAEKLKQYIRERGVTTLALGPGVGADDDAAHFALDALKGAPVPVVLDADGLNAVSRLAPEQAIELFKTRPHPCVVTPHPREAARLLRADKPAADRERVKTVERLARDCGGVALLKGSRSLISSGSRTVVNATGGPGLAKAGSGDVLTGLIAGLWAQLLASGRGAGDLGFQAAALGAWLHGKAGEDAEERLTPWGTTASDLVDALPSAFRALCG